MCIRMLLVWNVGPKDEEEAENVRHMLSVNYISNLFFVVYMYTKHHHPVL